RTLSAGCGGRIGSQRAVSAPTNDFDADGEVVWFWHPDADAKSARRFADDGGKKARSPGRARRTPLKPSRRECRMIWLNLWCLPPAFLFAGGPWVAASTRHSLRPLRSSRAMSSQPGRFSAAGTHNIALQLFESFSSNARVAPSWRGFAIPGRCEAPSRLA